MTTPEITKQKNTLYPPAPAAALERLEEKLGAPLPSILRACYMISNGGLFGHRDEWELHPVFDVSDRKRRKKTAYDILHFTSYNLKRSPRFPRNGICVARGLRVHNTWQSLFIKRDAHTGEIGEEIFQFYMSDGEWHPYAANLKTAMDPNFRYSANSFAPEVCKPAMDQSRAAELISPDVRRSLPIFRYYANPYVSDVFERSYANCECCEESSEYIYCGHFFYSDVDEPHFCPWCIADGSAAAKFEGEFNDSNFIGTGEISREVVSEVAERTPGFVSFQQGPWLAHCGNACRFLGDIGDIDKSLLETEAARDFMQSIREQIGLKDDEIWNKVLCTTNRERNLSIFVFACLHCGTLSGYPDYP